MCRFESFESTNHTDTDTHTQPFRIIVAESQMIRKSIQLIPINVNKQTLES